MDESYCLLGCDAGGWTTNTKVHGRRNVEVLGLGGPHVVVLNVCCACLSVPYLVPMP